jgi:hypothetical protein
MTRLQSELERLYLPSAEDGVRAAVLALARPADWERLGEVWRGVQAELGLPAPGIAVSGSEALQLWFSWRQPVPAAQAAAFVDALRRRWLGDLPAHRVEAPAVEPAAWPPQQPVDGQWSAFVAPDLAPLFSDTPWLDIPPNDDGQAQLLSQLQPITPPAWAAAQAMLGLGSATAGATTGGTTGPTPAAGSAAADDAGALEPQAFLLSVMRDERVALPLRIEAAKALLPYTGGR